jgi:hypothetical protein
MLAVTLPAFAQNDDPLDDHIMYGVSGSTDHLIRYDFVEGTYQSRGAIHFLGGTVLDGIEGLAYVPRNLNIFGFWTDADAQQTKLIYINSHTAQATPVGGGLGPGGVTAATTALLEWDEQGALVLPIGAGSGPAAVDADAATSLDDIRRTALFAVQRVEPEEDDAVDFEIDGGHVVPTEAYAAKVTILGAAITYGGTYDIPVTLRLRIGNDTFEPWGDIDYAVSGNVNDHQNPRQYIFPDIYDAGKAISIKARSWTKKRSWYSGYYNSHWEMYMTKDSYYNSSHILTLRHGDSVPNIEPFMNQTDIADFIRDYVNPANNTVVLDENQAIYLFELGTTYLNSDAADFQDLVVLVTLARDPADLEENDDDDEQQGVAARLVRVHTDGSGYEQIMTLDRVYDGLAASPTTSFYGTVGNEIYHLDPIAQTETLMGTLDAADMKGLEYAGSLLTGFTVVDGQLVPIDTAGTAIGNAVSIGVTDLQSIVYMRRADEPNGSAGAYD